MICSAFQEKGAPHHHIAAAPGHKTAAKLRKCAWGVLIAPLILLTQTPSHAASEHVRFVTYNVNFNSTTQEVHDDVTLLKAKADVLMFQETKNVTIDNFLGTQWEVYQVTNQGPGKKNAALAYRKSIFSQVLATGLQLGVDNHGEQMHNRYITWADLKLNNDVVIRVMSLHFPPGRFQYLQPIMADNFVDFVNATPYPVIAGGDFNFKVNDDRYNIGPRTGLDPEGKGIIGFYFDASAVNMTAIYALAGLPMHSDHNPVQIVTDIDLTTIIDNSDVGFSASSNWSTGVSAVDKYGSDYRFHLTMPDSDLATWTFNAPYAGDYEIFAWWSQGANRSITAPYQMPDNTFVYKNQQTGGGSWQSLGTYPLTAGNHQVGLSCWTSNGTVVIGDAIKVEPR